MADPAVPAERPPLGAPPSLAEQALANLVNQFARPLDFVRELVQNAIDAGSPRIAVTVGWQSPEPGEREGVLRLSVEDSPNSAGVAIDAIRCAKLAADRGLGGPIEAPSAFFMKHPPRQWTDEEAHRRTEAFVRGES